MSIPRTTRSTPPRRPSSPAISAASGRPARRRPDPRLRRHPAQTARTRRAAAGLPAARSAMCTASKGLVALFGIESPGLTSRWRSARRWRRGSCMDEVIFREANAADVPLIQPLVHNAYRGDRARLGWTHEADLLEAQRIDEDQLAASIDDPAPGHRAGRSCRGADRLRSGGRQGGLPGLSRHADGDATVQARGLGRRLIDRAEALARDRFGASRMEMTVIVQRTELIEWYERRGYHQTGDRRPFPASDPRFGVPLRSDLEFVVMERSLA
jgi:GNAT superfamily N-acetyltransferase